MRSALTGVNVFKRWMRQASIEVGTSLTSFSFRFLCSLPSHHLPTGYMSVFQRLLRIEMSAVWVNNRLNYFNCAINTLNFQRNASYHVRIRESAEASTSASAPTSGTAITVRFDDISDQWSAHEHARTAFMARADARRAGPASFAISKFSRMDEGSQQSRHITAAGDDGER